MSAFFPPQAEPAPKQYAIGNSPGRDLNIAGRDNLITNYLTGLRHLRPRPIKPDTYIPQARSVTPPNFEEAKRAINSDTVDAHSVHVVVLVASEAHGRKSAALRLLASTNIPSYRIFELLPDWETPDVSCLPKERNSGYLLNLRGVAQPLPGTFCEDLVAYSDELRSAGSYLVITATDGVWPQAHARVNAPGIASIAIGRPKASEIVERYLQAGTNTAPRAAWLNDPDSVFNNLLPENSAPTEAVRLAILIKKAKDSKDEEVLDEYHGWKSHLDEWFSKGGEQKVEERAKRIAGAFLNNTPASVVLDSADLLLAAAEINWQPPRGGPLALADAEERLKSVGLSFDESTGTASLIHESQGPAILRRIWTRHVQLSEVLNRWLQDISQGPAREHLDSLATSLTKLAETVGVTPIFALAEGWLQNGGKQHVRLVSDLISDLATHPTLGSKSRSELARWAKVSAQPVRQRAVALACADTFGKGYPSQALTRVRYILDSPGDAEAQREAINSLRLLATEEDLAPLVVDTIVKWLTGSTDANDNRYNAFLDVFGSLSPSDQPTKSPLEIAFSLQGGTGEAVRRRLLDAWEHTVEQGKYATKITEALLTWRNGAEDGRLPMTSVVDIILTLGRITGVMEPPLKAVVMPNGAFKDALLSALVSRFDKQPGEVLQRYVSASDGTDDIEQDQGQSQENPPMQ